MYDQPEESKSDDEQDLNNFPFYVNKSGFPIEEKTWDRMWRFAEKMYPDAHGDMYSIKNAEEIESQVCL